MSDRLIVLMMVVASDIHSVLEAPHLHGRDLEVFRAKWLIIESIAMAGSPMVQVCIKVEGLAITTSCRERKNTNVTLLLHFSGCEMYSSQRRSLIALTSRGSWNI